MDIGKLKGGYKTPYDVRPAIHRLTEMGSSKDVWDELWENLYHQSDIGEASLFAIIGISDWLCKQETLSWQPISLIASIDLAREQNGFDTIPPWIIDQYTSAINSACKCILSKLSQEIDQETLKAGLSMIAINGGNRKLARLILEVDIGYEEVALNKYFT